MTDVVKEGDKVWVKLLGFDDRGKVKLSMKVVDQTTGKELEKAQASSANRLPGLTIPTGRGAARCRPPPLSRIWSR